MKFPESKIAHKYLDGLKGIEIGGSAHNPFGLDTINVDRINDVNSIYKKQEFELCGEKMTVDVVAEADKLPFQRKSFDFVVSSHVIEHVFDPIQALQEWRRVARRYIVIICPHKNRIFDHNRPITTMRELKARHSGKIPADHTDKHHSVWDTQSFLKLLKYLNFRVIQALDEDDKVGNGFLVVIKLDR